jgi:predicted metal-dependent phosphoesterase TrpH
MRCDLHVHSWHSGKADLPLLRHVGRECYSDPLEVYERAVARGMDLFTLAVHVHEIAFAARLFRALGRSPSPAAAARPGAAFEEAA